MNRHGFSLIELLVTMTILGILAGVTTLAVRRFDPPRQDDPRQILADSLRVASETARTISLRFVVDGTSARATVRPDGSIVADSVLMIERFTGVAFNAK